MKKLDMNEPLSPLFTMHKEDVLGASEIFQAVLGHTQEPSGKLNAETFLSNLAALMGEMALAAGDPSVYNAPSHPKPSEQTIEFLESASRLFQVKEQKSKKCEKPSFSFDDILKHAQENAGNRVVLTADPFYDPHQPPEITAAMLRKQVQAIAKKYTFSPWELATSCAIAAMQALEQVDGEVIYPQGMAHQIAMETAMGIAHQKPLSSEEIDKPAQRVTAPKPVLQAANQITRLVVEVTGRSIGGARNDKEMRKAVLTTIGVAGALMGEMAARAGMKPMPEKPSILISAETSAFFEEAYPNFVVLCGHPTARKEKLPRFGDFASHAVASFGKEPYPNLTLAKEDQPSLWPPYMAAIIREDVLAIAKKNNLSDWELASASMCAAMKTITEAPIGLVKSVTAVRIVMEEAVAMSYVTPVDLDAIQKEAPENIRKSMEVLNASIRPERKSPFPT